MGTRIGHPIRDEFVGVRQRERDEMLGQETILSARPRLSAFIGPLLVACCIVLPAPRALAAGGGGGGSCSSGSFTGTGGGGGTSSATGAGGAGGPATGCGGGGGGGAGVTGGSGGDGDVAIGGAGGSNPASGGSPGADFFSIGGGGGGGGGAHGAVITTSTSNSAAVSGGDGGHGGNVMISAPGGGGGGGGGGYGVVVDGSGLTYANTGAVRGGSGGQGGFGIFDVGGFGGNGGSGVVFTGDGGTLVNSGSIAGGKGGAGGYGGLSSGLSGLGGIGIAGANLSIINSGSITGGLAGDGSTRANAIYFAGGSNVLELQAGSLITGNVVGANNDTLRLGGAAAATFDVSLIGSQYTGFSTFVKTGTGTWTLTGTTPAFTPWTIDQGTLAISSNGNLGNVLSGPLTFNGGALQFLADFNSNRQVTLNAGGGSLDTNGNSAILGGVIGGSGDLRKMGAGSLTLTNTNIYTGGTTISAGTLQLGNGGTSGSIAGDVVDNGVLAFNRSNTLAFAGNISGSGGVRQIGSGTTILTGANNYTGDTTIVAGTLQFAGSAAGTGSAGGGTGGSGGGLGGGTGGTGGSGSGLGGGTGGTGGPGGGLGGGTGGTGGSGSGLGGGTGGTGGPGGGLGGGTGGAGGSGSGLGGGTGGTGGPGGGLGGGAGGAGGPGGGLGGGTGGSGSGFGSGNLTVAGGTLAIVAPATVNVAHDVTFADNTAFTIAAGSNSPLLSAGKVAIGNGVAFNISGINDASQLDTALIDTRSGIIGDFGMVTVGGFNGTVDYLTVSTHKSADNLQYLATYGLSWMANNNLAHGTFTLTNASDTFTVGAVLTNQSANPATGWHGTSLTKAGMGTLILTGTNSYTGGTTISAGTLQLGNGGTTGAIVGDVVNDGVLAFNRSDALTFAGSISGHGAVEQTGSGTTILTGTNSYTGATNIDAGTLEVNGSIAASSRVTVNEGATLSGIGIVDPATTTIMAGGTLAPGNAANPAGVLTITGNLAFQSAAIYRVAVASSVSSSINVTGSATLGGATVNAVFGGGSYVNRLYSILTAGGGVSGTFAPGVVNINLPSGFRTNLSYDATHAYLNVSLDLMQGSSTGSGAGASTGSGGRMSGNQQAVDNAMMNSFNANGGIPMVYGMLSAAGLTQASGELATGSQQVTFDAMSQFMDLLTDPFMSRAGGGAEPAYSASVYTEEGEGADARKRTDDAFAMFAKAPPRAFEPRWSVWGAAFGGSQTTNGNTIVGSNDATSRLYGMAVGADYQSAPRTLAGFALAGGGAGFGVNGLGTGRSDLFQAGIYLRHSDGRAYVSAALAYGWQDVTTNRYVTVAALDHLQAKFNANAYSGRIEGGYRFAVPATGNLGITPYAAAQLTTFDLPAYAERALSGTSAFALAYGGRSVTDTRSELGIRSDKSFALPKGILTLRGRFAWAHDYNPDRSIAAAFQSLPGTSFTVNGAAQAPDSAFITASAEVKCLNGWSVGVTFEGTFSNVTSGYAGRGVVRYQW